MGRWIKLHESLLDDALWQMMTGDQRGAFVGLLLQVNWRPSEFGCRHCNKKIDVPVGATCRSTRTLAARAGVTDRVMRRVIKKLVENGFLVNKSGRRCHALYIVKNWERYQSQEEGDGRRTVTPTGVGRYEGRSKDGVCEEEVKKERLSLEQDDPALEVAEHHRRLILGYPDRGTVGIQTEKAWAKKRGLWAKTYRAIATHPGIPYQEQCELLTHAFEDDGVWGEGTTWRDVLSSGNPPGAWERNCRKLRKRAKSTPEARAKEARDREAREQDKRIEATRRYLRGQRGDHGYS